MLKDVGMSQWNCMGAYSVFAASSNKNNTGEPGRTTLFYILSHLIRPVTLRINNPQSYYNCCRSTIQW